MVSTTSKIILVSLFVIGASASEKTSEDSQSQVWRAVLGDICQLNSFPKATADPIRYVECVKQDAESNGRGDLGVWLLRECLPGYEFVASARKCKTVSNIRRQQKICDSADADQHDFCPPIQNNRYFTVEEIKRAPRSCTCPNGDANCVCPRPEILQPVALNTTISTRSKRQAGCNCQTPTATTAQPIYQNDCNCNKCTTTSTQQTYCPQNQPEASISQPQACQLVQGGIQNAQYQGICSWMVDALAVDPQSKTHYLQCQPAPKNLYCGRWQRMPCAVGTIFSAEQQVCIFDTNNAQPGNIPTPNPVLTQPGPLPTQPQVQRNDCNCSGGVQIGQCNQNYQCPGKSVCNLGTGPVFTQTQAPVQQQQRTNSNGCKICCYYA
uniref:Chitin-binding type-2 domain-containing protein n=1 Tax=Rhabditophanes sp. KR3021 TaxID=114890 RepID=A0AC35UFR5_9BILA